MPNQLRYEDVKRSMELATTECPHIGWDVEGCSTPYDDFDGAYIHLWYNPRETVDDGRELSNSSHIVCILRPTLEEAQSLGTLIQSIAENYSEHDVTLDEVHEGKFSYAFREK